MIIVNDDQKSAEKNFTAELQRTQRYLPRRPQRLGGEPSDPRLVSALFLHPDFPEESLIVQCLHYAGVDELIRVGFFCFRVLA